MADSTETPTPLPCVTIRQGPEGLQLDSNVQRPIILWMLEQAKLTVLTQPTTDEHSALVTPGNGFRAGLFKKLHG